MEIGSFIEMEFPKGGEYYSGTGVARLNSGRAGIYHAARVLGCSTIYLPYYQCETVREFLYRKHVKVRYYRIDAEFNPQITIDDSEIAIVIVNYYGVMSRQRLQCLANKYRNVIIDNSQAFFCKPIDGCLNVYSARKFIGVPDGAYVIGTNADRYLEDYRQDFSSDTSQFLLQRIEYGCEGKAYESSMLNERRIDSSDIRRMSKLTQTILNGANYEFIIRRRRENFKSACRLFDGMNRLNVRMHYADDCVPMVYPLVIENEELLNILITNKVFQGHWWSYLLEELDKSCFEYWLSQYIIPITIDQRYSAEDLRYCHQVVETSVGEIYEDRSLCK